MRRGFTLIEVTLAMGVMAMGMLGLVGLYAFGYRENQQSAEDVQAAAVALMHMNAMVAALSSTNMTWSAWCGIGVQPSNGWGTYAGDGSNAGIAWNDGTGEVTAPSRDACNSAAGGAFNKVMSAAGFSASFDPQGLAVGIVVLPSSDYRLYSVAVRCARRSSMLVYQPLYYTEVYYQGLKEEESKGK